MIQYAKDPIPLPEVSRVKAWLASPEADVFRSCIEANMHEHYLDAVNAQATDGDAEKFTAQANAHLARAREFNIFLKVMAEVSSDTYGMHRIKIQ